MDLNRKFWNLADVFITIFIHLSHASPKLPPMIIWAQCQKQSRRRRHLSSNANGGQRDKDGDADGGSSLPKSNTCGSSRVLTVVGERHVAVFSRTNPALCLTRVGSSSRCEQEAGGRRATKQ